MFFKELNDVTLRYNTKIQTEEEIDNKTEMKVKNQIQFIKKR